MITHTDYVAAREQLDRHAAWLKSTGSNSYAPSEQPAGCEYPGNEIASSVEVYEFCASPPATYFLYVNEAQRVATTWTGDKLGDVWFGREYRDNFGGKRRSVSIKAVNGATYHGTYFKSAGDYARIRMARTQQAAE